MSRIKGIDSREGVRESMLRERELKGYGDGDIGGRGD
jgi:hypothetical protein